MIDHVMANHLRLTVLVHLMPDVVVAHPVVDLVADLEVRVVADRNVVEPLVHLEKEKVARKANTINPKKSYAKILKIYLYQH